MNAKECAAETLRLIQSGCGSFIGHACNLEHMVRASEDDALADAIVDVARKWRVILAREACFPDDPKCEIRDGLLADTVALLSNVQ